MKLNIGEAIKNERKKNKLTQKELALKLDKSTRMVQKYENGEVIPSFEILKQIGEHLNVSLETFLTSEALELRKENAGFEGLKSILECIYDEVNFNYHAIINRDGEEEHDGTYWVFLKKNDDEFCLTKREYEILFNFVSSNIPNYIRLIVSHEDK